MNVETRADKESLWDRGNWLSLSGLGSGPEAVWSPRKECTALTQKHEQCLHLSETGLC